MKLLIFLFIILPNVFAQDSMSEIKDMVNNAMNEAKKDIKKNPSPYFKKNNITPQIKKFLSFKDCKNSQVPDKMVGACVKIGDKALRMIAHARTNCMATKLKSFNLKDTMVYYLSAGLASDFPHKTDPFKKPQLHIAIHGLRQLPNKTKHTFTSNVDDKKETIEFSFTDRSHDFDQQELIDYRFTTSKKYKDVKCKTLSTYDKDKDAITIAFSCDNIARTVDILKIRDDDKKIQEGKIPNIKGWIKCTKIIKVGF